MVENVSLMEKNINAPALLCFLATNVNSVRTISGIKKSEIESVKMF